MKFRTYQEWRDLVTTAFKETYKDQKVHDTNVKYSDSVRTKASGPAIQNFYTVVDGWKVSINDGNDISIVDAMRLSDSYFPATVIVRGLSKDGTDYTAYSIQMRPANYTSKVNSIAPVKFSRKVKIGSNAVRILSLNGSNWHKDSTYGVPSKDWTSTISGQDWLLYENDSGKPVDMVNERHFPEVCYLPRHGEYERARGQSARCGTMIGSTKTKTEWYESIRDTLRSIRGLNGTDARAMMTLAARCHKNAIEFAKNCKNGRVILLPMRMEREQLIDPRPRAAHHAGTTLSMKDDYRPTRFSSTSSGLHFLGDVTVGNGCLLPSILVQWEPKFHDNDGVEWLTKMFEYHSNSASRGVKNSVVITIPPVGSKNLSPEPIMPCTMTVEDPDHLIRGDTDPYGYSRQGRPKNSFAFLCGEPSRLNPFVDCNELKAYPSKTFVAVTSKKKIWTNDDNWEIAYLLNNLFSAQNGTGNSDIYLAQALPKFLFDFSKNPEHVAVEMHLSGPDNLDWKTYPVPEKPDDIFAGLEQQAYLDSLPLC